MGDCNICCEPYKGKARKQIVCNHCGFGSCATCTKTYILDSLNDARCMSPGCKKVWSREFLIESFSYTFVDKTYKKHKESLLYDRQLSMMEETQAIIEERADAKKINDKILEIDKQIRELRNKKTELVNERYNLQYKESTVKGSASKYFGHCPESECKGFINASGKCGICEIKVCKTCKEKLTDIEIEDPGLHICDPNVVESIRQIKRDCRNCPKCKTSIQRISGCRQMFCTQCHTSFDWKTGEIVIGMIHNPHFSEWQRNNGGVGERVDAVDPCNADRAYNIQYYSVSKALEKCDKEDYVKLNDLFRFIRHVKYYDMADMNRTLNGNKDLDYRIDFMTNKIDLKTFQRKLQALDKKQTKQREVYMVYDMFTNTVINSFVTYVFNGDIPSPRYNERGKVVHADVEKIGEFNKILNKLVDYTNESLTKIGKKYKNQVPLIVTESGMRETRTGKVYQYTYRTKSTKC